MTIHLFACCFEDKLLDTFLERHAIFEVGMSHDGDHGYENIRQAWMVIVQEV
jgi:hypothetical protein